MTAAKIEAPAAEQSAPPAPASKGVLAFIGGIVVLTLSAAAGGAGVGLQVFSTIEKVVESRPEPTPLQVHAQYTGSTQVHRLQPILTNLAVPEDVWIRLESSVVFQGELSPHPELLASQIGQDILSYLRTVSLAQIQGASGLQHLREDLSERASIRSEGAAREVIIETLVVQ